MSKRYPLSPRKYDLYVAFPEEVQPGRVLFGPGRRRFVIREKFSRRAWDAERALPPAPGPRGLLGVGVVDDKPLPDHLEPDGSLEVPADLKYFYGADYLSNGAGRGMR